jgi:hypothetical protein
MLADSILTRCFLAEGSAWVAAWLHLIGRRSEVRAESATFLLGLPSTPFPHLPSMFVAASERPRAVYTITIFLRWTIPICRYSCPKGADSTFLITLAVRNYLGAILWKLSRIIACRRNLILFQSIRNRLRCGSSMQTQRRIPNVNAINCVPISLVGA